MNISNAARPSLLRIGLLTLALGCAFSAAAAPKKILVITQSKGFMHGAVRRPAPEQLCLVEKTLDEIGKASGVFTTVHSQDAIGSITRDNLKQFDAVFFYTTGILLPAGDPREALTDFVRSGKGFIGTHSATDTFHGGKEAFTGYVKMINGSFAGHPWGSGTTCTFTNHDPQHPAVAMYPAEFQWKDEIYQYSNYDPASVRVLLSLDMTKTRPLMPYLVPVSWVREYGEGRLFYTNLGHNETTWKDATFQKHLLEGMRWALKLVDGSAAPNPQAQQVQHNRAVVAFAAAESGRDASRYLAKAADASWVKSVTEAVEVLRKLPNPDPKKAPAAEVEAAKQRRSAAIATLQTALDR